MSREAIEEAIEELEDASAEMLTEKMDCGHRQDLCLGLESIYEKEYLPLGWFSLDRQMYWFGWETKNER